MKTARETIRLRHSRMELALHKLRAANSTDADALLLLHGLGECAPQLPPQECAKWPGEIWALDFSGHGQSARPKGGGYTCEQLMGDADAALSRLQRAAIMGRGLGAYIALLLAGARPRAVRGAVLCDGLGLAGGGPAPVTPQIVFANPAPPDFAAGAPDPYALAELARDVRPPDYALAFLRQALELSGLEKPVHICAAERPEWLAACAREMDAEGAPPSPAQALAECARHN